MKTIILSALAALSLMTAAAHAEGEGNGDPFPFRAPGVVTAVQPGVSSTAVAGAPRAIPLTHPEAEVAQATTTVRHR